MKSKKISIVTVCKNAEKTIERTILSVVNQTYSDIEYIIIDGKSTDNTLEIVNKYKDKISRIISEKDNGIFDAMNKAIDFATGDFINFMNSDDFFDSNNVIENVVKAINKYSDCELLFGDYKYCDVNKDICIERCYKDMYLDYYFFIKQNLNHQSIFYKKSIFEKFGKYEDTRCKITADTDYNMNLVLKQKINVYYLPIYIANYSMKGFSSKNEILFNQEKKKILKKYYGLGIFRENILKLIACLDEYNLFSDFVSNKLNMFHRDSKVKIIN